MFNYYSLDIIPIILTRFKVSKILATNLPDEKISEQILNYCECNNAFYEVLDSENILNSDFSNNFVLDELPNLKDFDAIFLNDDPNWYTVFNELNIIEDNNPEFPLVFICNDIFPHKRRDSYINPDWIPAEFLNNYSKNLDYNGITLRDEFFHASEENTPHNGVSTAIEDFINEHSSIGIMDIRLLNGITILYHKDNISYIRLGRLAEEIEGYELEFDNVADNFVENHILTNHIIKFNLVGEDVDFIDNYKIKINEKDKIINDFENKIEIHNAELSLKDSKIENLSSEIDLSEIKFKNIESKLTNKNFEIDNLNNQLNDINIEINSLKSEFSQRETTFKNRELDLTNQINSLKSNISRIEERESELKNQLRIANNKINDNVVQLNNQNENIILKDNQIKINELRLTETLDELNSIKRQYINQLSKLDNKNYCISCYKEEIDNNHVEIEYLKNDTLTKKLLSPFAYVYLIFKSKPGELSLNFKLYKAIKNSKCFDIGFYLNNNKDIQESKWCRYFSPELHYVCNGFNEERTFNKKYFNRNSKKELLDYILNCKY